MRYGRIIRSYEDSYSIFPELSGRICTLRINNKDTLEPMDLSRIFADLALHHPTLDLGKVQINSDSVEVFIKNKTPKAP